ncbi:hypothetical protein HK105_200766 [Polyrhizophydium stewartii]|uniref:Dynein light intermediate chain n=1 Tax=Polyrhizophydium stewartii TaxID=2732419 RepID=A0ABR4NK94_9FUNG
MTERAEAAATVGVAGVAPAAGPASTSGAEEDVWSSILGQVATSKSTASATLLVCGDGGPLLAGLVEALNSTSADGDAGDQANADLGMAYSCMDINDDENETVARIGIHQLANSPVFHSLVDYAITLDSMSTALAAIVLDWSRPWDFLTSLNAWLAVLEAHMSRLADEDFMAVDDLKRRRKSRAALEHLLLESCIREYTDPEDPLSRVLGTAPAPPRPRSASPERRLDLPSGHSALPLGEGVLNRSIGLPIVVVCHHSEVLSDLEKDFKETHFDFIQQTLRAICLSYGAALFYVSQKRPETIENLRAYLLHRLLGRSSGAASHSNRGAAFDFSAHVQVVERDAVLIPAGWDSWGKIRAQSEGFRCDVFAGLVDPDFTPNMPPPTDGPLGKLIPLYQTTIRDRSPKYTPKDVVDEPENEQEFLDGLLEKLPRFDEAAEVDGPHVPHNVQQIRDATAADLSPRRKTQAPTLSKSQAATNKETLEDFSARLAKLKETTTARDKSLLTSSSLAGGTLPEVPVKRILERTTSSGPAEPSPLGRISPVAGLPSTSSTAPTSISTAAAASGGALGQPSPTTSPSIAGATAVAAAAAAVATGANPASLNGNQNEVLANFFQSLLAKKGASGGTTRPSSPSSNRRSINKVDESGSG